MNEKYKANELVALKKGEANENIFKAEVEYSKEYSFKKLSEYGPVMKDLYTLLYEQRVYGKISFENGGEDQKILSLLDRCSPGERERITKLVTDERFASKKNTAVVATEILIILLAKERPVVHQF